MVSEGDSQSRPAQIAAALLTLAFALVVVTPLCGALFRCGCTWPWAGLDRHCNVHDPADPAHCPWCVHPRVAAATFAVSAALGVVAAWGLPVARRRPWLASSVRAGVGVAVYALGSTIGAWWIARAVGYPHFLGR